MPQQQRTIQGYVANEPKQITTQSGQELAVFKIMENNRYFDREAKQWRDGEPTTYDVAVGQEQLRANVLASLQKGQRVQIEGNYQPKAYVDRNGEAQVGHQVWANDVAASYMHEAQERGEAAPTGQRPMPNWDTPTPDLRTGMTPEQEARRTAFNDEAIEQVQQRNPFPSTDDPGYVGPDLYGPGGQSVDGPEVDR